LLELTSERQHLIELRAEEKGVTADRSKLSQENERYWKHDEKGFIIRDDTVARLPILLDPENADGQAGFENYKWVDQRLFNLKREIERREEEYLYAIYSLHDQRR